MGYIKDPAQWQITYRDDWEMYQYLFWTVSQKKRFAFIHVPRCAGTSMDVDLRGKIGDAKRGYVVVPSQRKHYHKVAFMRNPWDRLVSAYFQYERNAHVKLEGGFTEFVHEVVLVGDHDEMWRTQPKGTYDHWLPYKYFIGPPEAEIPDFIGRYENLGHDYNEICMKLGITSDVGWSANTRSKRDRDYKFYYDHTMKNLIGDFYAEDIARFNYDF